VRTATLRFEPAGWEIEIYPATSENEGYVTAMKLLAFPHQLALELERLSDERAADIMAHVVAESVVKGSSTPGLPDSLDGWHAWLLEHPEEFEVILSTARLPNDWERMSDGAAQDDIQELR